MTTCFQHPDQTAIERCEVCQRPVCGHCLWYAHSGERLCPEHAAERLQAGQTVIPPERYAASIPHSAVTPKAPRPVFQGNDPDVNALAAAIGGVASLLMCMGMMWAVPLLAFGFGALSWTQAKHALDPHRTRQLAAVGMLGSAAYVVLIVVMVFGFLACLLAPILFAASNPGLLRPTPYPFPTP